MPKSRPQTSLGPSLGLRFEPSLGPNPPELVALALGSNLGARADNLAFGIAKLKETGFIVTALSGIYETKPLYLTDQPLFLNMALLGHSAKEPLALLQDLKTIENLAGRVLGGIRFGPRVLDLDIIFYGKRQGEWHSDEQGRPLAHPLALPHSRYHERDFVLSPLCEIAGDFVCPKFGKSLAQLKAEIETPSEK